MAKLYWLAEIMLEQTDEEHYITMPEILEALAVYGVTADRKSIYQDLRDIEELGAEVEGEPVDAVHNAISESRKIKFQYYQRNVCRQFTGWIMSLGERIKIIGPDLVVDRMRNEIRRLGNNMAFEFSG